MLFVHTRGYLVNFFEKVNKESFKKLLLAGMILAVMGGLGGLTYRLFGEVQSDVVVVRVDGKEMQFYAPDWEVEDILSRADVVLGERDRVQITKVFNQPLVFTVMRDAISLEESRRIVATSRGETAYKVVHEMEATAYLPTDGDGQCITATGIRATAGVVAVDPEVIPLGSRVYIPGYGFAIAADTGGAIIGNRIDLCMEDYDEAIQFGRRPVKVYVL